MRKPNWKRRGQTAASNPTAEARRREEARWQQTIARIPAEIRQHAHEQGVSDKILAGLAR